MNYKKIDELPREKLIELISNFSKNWLAMDGLWFQSIEKKYDLTEAMEHDINVWLKFGAIEANRIKTLLSLEDNSGIYGLQRALGFRLYSPLNKDKIEIDGNALTYYTESCRVQDARSRKGLPLHPCKQVGIVEHRSFAQAIDERFDVECVSCYPDITIPNCACVWRFTLNE